MDYQGRSGYGNRPTALSELSLFAIFWRTHTVLSGKITTDAGMHVITEKRIWEAIERWPGSAGALDAWYRLIKALQPRNFAALKAVFPALDKVGGFHVFDIGGNKIRLIAVVHYLPQRLYIIKHS